MTEHPPPEAPAGAPAAGAAGTGSARTGSTLGGSIRGAHRARRSRRNRLAVLLAVLVVVVVVVAAVVLVVGRQGGATQAGADPGPDAARGIPADVADWVDAELPDEATLGAPEDLLATAATSDIPADRLVGADDGDLQLLEGDPGADAVVVARFPGEDGRALTVVDPAPVEPTAEELARRQRLSAAVLANPVAGATGRAAAALRAADVDARLLGLVAVLVARLDVGIGDLPRAPGQPEEGTPARRALLVTAAGEDLVSGSAAAERVRDFVAAQEPPFAPDTVEVTEDGLLVGFDYSSAPDAAVTDATR